MGENGLGLDSIELAQVVLACEEETGVTVTEEVFSEGPLTIGALVVYLSRS